MGKLYIHATNVHQGGGKALLWSIIKSMPDARATVLILDSRMALPVGIRDDVLVKRVSPSILQRARAERWLNSNVQPQDIVLCFGNLPPLFRLSGRVVVFVQNRYLVDATSLGAFPLKVGLRLAMERCWLSTKMSNANEFIVQTPTMKRLLDKMTRGAVPVRMLPFVSVSDGYARSTLRIGEPKEKEFDFIYVASGEPHKNHQRLLEAWCLLADEGLFPTLCLTLSEDRFAALCDEIEVLRQRHGIAVTNVGELSHLEALALYGKAGALIFPSIFESFGLPMIEARQAGLPVLASELDYVRDVLDPEQTFDPASANSIARAVKRFMGKPESALPLLEAWRFIEYIMRTREWDDEIQRN